ncbi:hypothetical protein M0G43_03130 [Subsaxibacter sp. CAU 1640]|uniref:hypothetical protein n=1 Tax=Subsaxibacter sp. CAU 1640 TaxID=2933271 RepID=UPI0020034283|nr:hypothetical protein [Subsaxibacter sp. CAU 1640]MCK7589560.1 hypothetical protein [Subsaxibacter sp. CAU 1640]
MISIKAASIFAIMIVVVGCSSAQKLQSSSPIDVEEVYFQKWVAGVKGGGSGIDLFIHSKNKATAIELDSVYFRGKAVKLETIKDENLIYVGRFKTEFNKKQDIVMSSDPNEEYGNSVPNIPKKIPFELKDSECVISYKQNGDIRYFKLENITEKPSQNYPSAPVKKD